MIAMHPDDLTCDFAETYHVFNLRELSPTTAAVLANGLREDSRVKMKLSKQNATLETLILATIADRVGLQLWAGSKDARHNRNRPESIVELLQGQEDKAKTFRTAAEFDAAFNNLVGGE